MHMAGCAMVYVAFEKSFKTPFSAKRSPFLSYIDTIYDKTAQNVHSKRRLQTHRMWPKIN